MRTMNIINVVLLSAYRCLINMFTLKNASKNECVHPVLIKFLFLSDELFCGTWLKKDTHPLLPRYKKTGSFLPVLFYYF